MKRRTFDDTGYPCESEPIEMTGPKDDAWFYTQQEGLVVCLNGCPNCGRQRNAAILRWPAINRALEDRKAAPARARRAKSGRGLP